MQKKESTSVRAWPAPRNFEIVGENERAGFSMFARTAVKPRAVFQLSVQEARASVGTKASCACRNGVERCARHILALAAAAALIRIACGKRVTVITSTARLSGSATALILRTTRRGMGRGTGRSSAWASASATAIPTRRVRTTERTEQRALKLYVYPAAGQSDSADVRGSLPMPRLGRR